MARRRRAASNQGAMTVKRIWDLVVDDSGQDLVEYALTTGLLTIASAVFVFVFMILVNVSYSNVLTGVWDSWEPCAPGAC